jgi:hypothetical protein
MASEVEVAIGQQRTLHPTKVNHLASHLNLEHRPHFCFVFLAITFDATAWTQLSNSSYSMTCSHN